MDFYKGCIPILNDDRPADRDILNPRHARKGYVERDHNEHPKEMFSPPSEMVQIPQSDWDAYYDEQEAQQSSLEHLFLRGGKPAFVNLDQNGAGFCWAYSCGHALMMTMLASNQPIKRMNPHSVASIIKGGRDEGGWCGLSAAKVREIGMAEEGTGPGQWPLHSMSLSNDTPATRTSMAKYKIVEDYVDLTRDVYDQNLTDVQLASCLFRNIPSQVDFNWWSHSVCAIRKVRISAGNWGTLILNSWLGWGRFGLAVQEGQKGIPDGAVAARVIG